MNKKELRNTNFLKYMLMILIILCQSLKPKLFYHEDGLFHVHHENDHDHHDHDHHEQACALSSARAKATTSTENVFANQGGRGKNAI